jgi:alkanesulfonate monooxygenase SsuD/methylene tetrahydromethanopterin reductase-like flavin-dependent oxidoreductase (luciferase family)
MIETTSGVNKLKLGIFAANCSGGQAATTVAERWDADWEKNRALAMMADEAGIDFMLPIARWLGYGGASDFQGNSLETITWATALLACTQNITVFATTHAAFVHPVMAAKQFATMDQIGRGRLGVNVVCGWNKPEYDMFGLALPEGHAERYAYGEEWLGIVRRIWTDKTAFDWKGDFFKLHRVGVMPKPFGGGAPLIMNAAASTEGRVFAARHAAWLVTSLVDLDRARADAAQMAPVKVIGTSYVVCRPTSREARDYHEYYANQHGDWEAVDRLMQLQGQYAKSFSSEHLATHRLRFAGGHGTYPLIGSPDEIADELGRISDTGIAGVTIAFVDYLAEFPFFRDEVLPRLARKGLRSSSG